MVDLDIHVLSHLKEELAWAVVKRLWVISTIVINYLKDNKSTKELKETNE